MERNPRQLSTKKSVTSLLVFIQNEWKHFMSLTNSSGKNISKKCSGKKSVKVIILEEFHWDLLEFFTINNSTGFQWNSSEIFYSTSVMPITIIYGSTMTQSKR